MLHTEKQKPPAVSIKALTVVQAATEELRLSDARPVMIRRIATAIPHESDASEAGPRVNALAGSIVRAAESRQSHFTKCDLLRARSSH
jgi:hypothetical protein